MPEPTKPKKPTKAQAVRFLKRIDEDEDARKLLTKAHEAAMKAGKKLGYEFTPAQLERALVEKWGVPKNREGMDHPYTCCFSESLL